MEKIVPFKKEIKFEKNLNEIISIALEHTYKKEQNSISGDFILNGEYKTDNDILPFEYNVPFKINLDEKYILDNIDVKIEDFYYEIKNNKLLINIELSIEKLEERCVEEELFEQVNEPIKLEPQIEDKYTTYKVYIVEESDTIESICNKYSISKEELEKYNDLNNFKTKDKIVIPYIFDEPTK